jgi:peptidoglycan/LPS O-acetylase OafA/YrhL
MDPLEAFTHRRYTTGLASVAMFFVLSGFLICRSALGSGSVLRFLWHRFLRIFPGYWVCLVICACVFVPLMAFAEYGTLLRVFSLPRNSPQSFMLHNAGLFHLNGFSISGLLFTRQDSIGGLLTHNPVPRVINGSLWTLSYEVSCYLAVAVLTAVGVLRRARCIVLTSFALLWCLHFFDYVNPAGFWRCFPYTGMKDLVMLCLFFLAGCVGFLYREKIPHSTTAFVGCLIIVGVSLPMGAFGLIAPIAMSYAFLWLAFILPFGRFDRKGDFSYGTYIYAFPVQQGLALLRIQDEGFGLYFTGSLLLTLVLAFLSYRLIEAPCLRWKAVKVPTFWRRVRSPVAQLIEECPRPDAASALP